MEVGLLGVGFSVEAGVGCGVIGAGVLFGEGVMGAAGVGEGVTGAGVVGLLLGDFVGGELVLGAPSPVADRRSDSGTAPTVDRASRWAYLSSRSSKSCALGDLLPSSWLA